MKLAVITPEKTMPGEMAIVNQMLAMGLPALHVRKPHYSHADYRAYVEAVPQQYHSRLVLHGGFGMWQALQVGGIHLSTHARQNEDVQQQIATIPAVVTSVSFHSWQEVMNNDVPYRYIFISPVYSSISKPGYEAGIALHGAQVTKQYLHTAGRHCPGLYALGGVAPQHLAALHEHGFDGAALLGSIWLANDPVLQLAAALAAVGAITGQ